MEEKDIERIVRQCLKELAPKKSVNLETAKLLIEAVEKEAARIGVKDSGFKILRKKLSPLIPVRLSSHAVTVVPMFAP